MDFDTIILGAGAAGMMCAAQTPGRCLVVDHAKAAGEKIRISGGGRCNFTNMYAEPSNFISQNPHFVKSALSRYTQWDFIDWVAREGIPYHEKTLGQLFCDNSAKDIIAMLRRAMEDAGAQLRLNTKIERVERSASGFDVSLTTAEKTTVVSCKNVVVATGGKPIPKMGASDFGLRLAQQFGLPVTHTVAGLVPFTFTGQTLEDFKSIAGVALPVRASAGLTSFEEAALFTHRGLSGPAALQISSYWSEGQSIELQLLSPQQLDGIITKAHHAEGRKSIATILARHLPARLVPLLMQNLPLPPRVADMSKADQMRLEERLTRWSLTPAGTEGYRTAEVMVGGVDTNALSSKTMEAKDIAGLYFIGECVDVTGWLGGYNFQWAWSSGWAAAQAIKAKLA